MITLKIECAGPAEAADIIKGCEVVKLVREWRQVMVTKEIVKMQESGNYSRQDGEMVKKDIAARLKEFDDHFGRVL